MSDRRIIATGDFESGEELVIQKRRKTDKISYCALGDGKGSRSIDRIRKQFNKEKVIYMDAVQELINMNESEGFFFKLLVDEHTYFDLDAKKYIATSIVSIDIFALSRTEKNKVTRGFKSLEKKNIVRRIKRGGHYCINPTMLVVDEFNKEYDYYMSLNTTYVENDQD